MTSAQDLAYASIKSRILSCELEPGSRLVAADLADEVGVSRTPVREALSRLEQEDMVVRESGWGYVVKSLSLKDVMDLYRVREILEVEAAIEAISHVDEVHLEMLKDVLLRAEKAMKTGTYSSFISLVRGFTGLIAEMTTNLLLQDMISRITDRIQIVGSLMVRHNLSRANEILAENKRILEALARKDKAAVERAMRLHIQSGREGAARLVMARNREAAAHEPTAVKAAKAARVAKAAKSPAPARRKR